MGTPVFFALLLSGVLLLAVVLTGLLRRYALKHHVIDTPNARSSHTVPTPRGGGVAIVIAFLLALPLLAIQGLADWHSLIALAGAGLIAAVLGFLDDHADVAARWRLLGHFAAAGWALFWLNGLPPFDLFGTAIDLGWPGVGIAILYLVWLLNLYNFMDGIDGIASVEAISVTLGAAGLSYIAGHGALAVAPLVLTAAVAGFLCWNFPPAKIFMGDAGSGFLGIILGVMSLQAAWVNTQLFWCWLILLGVFVVDATLTLLRRLLRGERVYQAHRSHGYQWAARKAGKHLPITIGILLINIVWLYPVAYLVASDSVHGLIGVVVAYAPLSVLALSCASGKSDGPT